MRLSKFEFHAPKTLTEAIALLQSEGPDVRLMAGGTDLLMKIKLGAVKPKSIVSLKSIPGLNAIHFDEQSGLTIGATALLSEVAEHPDILKYYPTVAQAARATANVQVRNMGTVVGNLCNASPAADNAPIHLAMCTEVLVEGPDGKRSLPSDQFFRGPGVTALLPAEIVTAVRVPRRPEGAGTAYHSLSARGKLDCNAVGAAAMVTLRGRVCEDVRFFISACGPTPLRAKNAEAIVRGKELTKELVEQAGSEASAESLPITDLRATADYRTQMVVVLTRRVLEEAHEMALKS